MQRRPSQTSVCMAWRPGFLGHVKPILRRSNACRPADLEVTQFEEFGKGVSRAGRLSL
jgi:hypothetical protein